MKDFNKTASGSSPVYDSPFPLTYITRANGEQRRGQPYEAYKTLESGLKQHPQSAALWSAQGKALEQMGLDDEARASYEKAYALKPDDIHIVMSYGGFLGRIEYFDVAEEVYLNAFTDRRDDYRLLTALGNVYQEIFDYELAAACFGRALQIRPDDAVASRRAQEVFTRFKESYTQEGWDNFCARHEDITAAPQLENNKFNLQAGFDTQKKPPQP